MHQHIMCCLLYIKYYICMTTFFYNLLFDISSRIEYTVNKIRIKNQESISMTTKENKKFRVPFQILLPQKKYVA
jgi:hypothetical protein